MSVEFIDAAYARALIRRIEAARQRALDARGVPPAQPDAGYWESLFEANAAAVLAALPSVKLAAGFVVRYRFYGARGQDLLVRPFVARLGTGLETVRQLLDWHPAPDSVAAARSGLPTQDVELLYRHFSFSNTAAGVFEYWLAMQEAWASARWAHSRLVVSANELRQLTAGEGWHIVHPVEVYEPAVVRGSGGARMAVLQHSPLGRFEVTLQQIEIAADQSLCYGQPVTVAEGPKGYVL
jgi:hypothetical protein